MQHTLWERFAEPPWEGAPSIKTVPVKTPCIYSGTFTNHGTETFPS